MLEERAMFIWKIIETRGIRKDWLAAQLGVSPSQISKLRKGERTWSDELKHEASRVLMLPEEFLFFDPDKAKDPDPNGHPASGDKEI
jgi:transcriptional regulator with XRE-family HTH domain